MSDSYAESLAVQYPELAKEWHPTKNGELTPWQVTPGSDRIVWWQLAYQDPKSEDTYLFEWQAKVRFRVKGNGCPYLTNRKVKQGFNDLESRYPGLVKEWHPTKNGSLTPRQVTAGTAKKVWWLLEYTDPKTRKNHTFEWQDSVRSRTSGAGCPYLTGKKIRKGFNDFESQYPDLVKEWHPTKNGMLTPDRVMAGSNRKVWWYLEHTDSETGESYQFEWQAAISKRVNGSGCPYLDGKMVVKEFNSLAGLYPALAKEWHPIKNKSLTPDMVSAKSSRKVWWYKKYSDPQIGKTFELEWQATVYSRAEGADCPYLTGKKILKGFNDLQSRYPALAKEWHPTKNGSLRPDQVIAGSNKMVWWYIRYSDFEGKKEFELEWQARISARTSGEGCPYLTGKKVLKGFNDLKTRAPQLAKEWHPTKNGSLRPDQVTLGSNTVVWWYIKYKEPKTRKVFNLEWQASVSMRAADRGCPYLSGKKILKGFNDLESQYPQLSKEWHPTKNGSLRPDQVTPGTAKKVWWFLPYKDPVSKKQYQFEWQASIQARVSGVGCPYLSGKKILKGFNDLESKYPSLAKEWHPTKNKELRPDMVTACSNKRVWWFLEYFDPVTEKIFLFEWTAVVSARTAGARCPYLTGQKVLKGFNDVKSRYPMLADEWHPTKNRFHTPENVGAGSCVDIWWKCPQCSSSWMTSLSARVNYGQGCPVCGHAVII